MRAAKGLILLLAAMLAGIPPSGAATADPFAAAKPDFRPGVQVPLDAAFLDQSGRPVTLADLLDGRPVILAPVYYTCPNLCGFTLSGIADAVQSLGAEAAGDYRVIAFSFDARETPTDATTASRQLGPAAPGIALLTGAQPAIDQVTAAIGFRYEWDESLRQFAHPAGLAVLTPDGRTSRWLSGVSFPTRDLRLALTEAGAGRFGDVVDRLLLLCFHYDPATGRYSSLVDGALRVGGIGAALALAGFVGLSLRREQVRRRVARR